MLPVSLVYTQVTNLPLRFHSTVPKSPQHTAVGTAYPGHVVGKTDPRLLLLNQIQVSTLMQLGLGVPLNMQHHSATTPTHFIFPTYFSLGTKYLDTRT